MSDTGKRVWAAFTSFMLVLCLVPMQGIAEAVSEVGEQDAHETEEILEVDEPLEMEGSSERNEPIEQEEPPVEEPVEQVEPLEEEADAAEVAALEEPSLQVQADDSDSDITSVAVSYVDDDGTTETQDECRQLCATDTQMVASESGSQAWYVVDGVVDTNYAAISVTGDINLILADGASLLCGGLVVNRGSTLRIYGQQLGDGALKCSHGVAISNKGSLCLYGGRITGSGTGIRNGGDLLLHGGAITGNTCGIDMMSGKLTVGHAPVVEGNGRGDMPQNIALSIGATLRVDSVLRDQDKDARIGLTLKDMDSIVYSQMKFTAGYSTYHSGVDPNEYFFCDNPNLSVAHGTTNGEAMLLLNISYVDEKGNAAYYDGAWTDITSSTSELAADGWYAVTRNETIAERLKVSRKAKLVLFDGVTLTCEKGIEVTGSLTIYGQAEQTGALVATAKDENRAGIGANEKNNGTVTICGGNIKATGAKYGAGIGGGGKGGGGGTINIYGGNVEATSGNEAAAIGGGNDGGSGGKITIYGGTVTAKAQDQYGSGIGGGDGGKCGTVTIKGGTVTATGASFGAGIGSGDEAGDNTGTITISGGDVKAYGGDEAAGIGGGNEVGGGTVKITGRHTTVLAKGACTNNKQYGAAIGGGDKGDGGSITIEGGAYVEAYSAENKRGQTIGHGHGTDKEGKLAFGADMAVKDDNGPVSKRVETCRNTQHVIVYRCKHEKGSCTPTPDGLKHVVKCNYCDMEGTGDHDYDDDGLCMCGMHKYTITLEPGSGTGAPQIVYSYQGPLQPGGDYVLPGVDNVPFEPPMEGISLLGWKIGDVYYRPGQRIMVMRHMTLTALWTTPWQMLQKSIDDAADGDTVTCDEDVTALFKEDPITIPAGKTITIDLAGHRLDRGLKYEGSRANGSVLVNAGTLTIRNGTITGGNATGDGGGICNTGSLAIDSVSVIGNGAEGNGGAISNTGPNASTQLTETNVTHNFALGDGGGVFNNGAKTSLIDATVTRNEAGGNGGGVYVDDTGGGGEALEITGAVTVEDNVGMGGSNNTYLTQGKLLKVADSLAAEARVGVTTEQTPSPKRAVMLTGSKIESLIADLHSFTSDNESYAIGFGTTGSVVLGQAATIRFDAGIGTGQMDSVTTAVAGKYKLPACDFEGPIDGTFVGWLVGDAIEPVDPGTKIDVVGDVTVTAKWVTLWTDLQERINEAKDDATVALIGDTKAYLASDPITISKGKSITIDLAGYSLDRRLATEDAREGGSVIENNGTLTLTGGGIVTGGNVKGNGGGISNMGTLTLDGVVVSGNAATNNGGGIYAYGRVTIVGGSITDNVAELYDGGGIYNSGRLRIDGCSITNNTSGNQGGGVLAVTGSQMSVSGPTVIAGNKGNKGGQDDNVYLRQTALIDVADELDTSAHIGVSSAFIPTSEEPVTISSGLKGKGDVSYFTSDDASYVIGADESGEALLGTPVTVSFTAGGARGSMENVSVACGSWWSIPECEFVGDFGDTFAGWTVGNESYVRWPGQRMKVTDDAVLRATWNASGAIKFPTFRTVSLVLSGRIGVNFFVDLTMLEGAEREASYVTFEVNGVTQDVPYDVDFTDARTGKYHGFTCYVNSIQMAEDIQATLHYGDGLIVGMVYSVEDYVKYAEGHRGSFDAKVLSLVECLADYGHYAQPMLAAENGWVIGEDYAEMKTHFTDSYDLVDIKAGLAGYAAKKDFGGTRVGSATARLWLDSGTMIEMVLKPAKGQTLSAGDVTATFAVQGKEPVVEQRRDGSVSVRLDNVSAHQLGVPLVARCDGKEVLSLSALSYAGIAIGLSTESELAMSALYCYHAAALGRNG